MSIVGSSRAMPDHDFRLGDWLVQPRLNRLGRAGSEQQIEPKLMDVLVLLAARNGAVVSKQEINDTVWAGVFVTESVITRAIAGLRRVLGDDAQRPTFIETISKRGYRLLVRPVSVDKGVGGPAGAGDVFGGRDVPAEAGHALAPSPYVVGQWVRGERFYGRGDQIAEILHGSRGCIWLLGMRRIGKTSVLKQLELLTAGCEAGGHVPVYWDLEGAQGVDDLHLDLEDALLDAGDRLERLGIDVESLGGGDVLSLLGNLRRAVRAAGRRLLLLCDEAEELIRLRDESPRLLRRLRNALHARDGIRTVLAASPRLWALADAAEDTSPFLEAFLPPVLLGPLADDEAASLALQSQLEPDRRPPLAPADAQAIAEHAGRHPYLIQLLSRRVLDHGGLEPALEITVGERSLGFFFAVDHQLLTPSERSLLHAVAETPADPVGLATVTATDPAENEPHIRRLIALGLLRTTASGALQPASTLLRRWLLDNP